MEADIEIEAFIEQWPDEPGCCRGPFARLYHFVKTLERSAVSFHVREGISYSLRTAHRDATDKELFVMVDVIDDTPRWLSVCFYEKMVSDPETRGDSVPGGLLGEDGICFDVDSPEPGLLDYLQQRIIEAHRACCS